MEITINIPEWLIRQVVAMIVVIIAITLILVFRGVVQIIKNVRFNHHYNMGKRLRNGKATAMIAAIGYGLDAMIEIDRAETIEELEEVKARLGID